MLYLPGIGKGFKEPTRYFRPDPLTKMAMDKLPLEEWIKAEIGSKVHAKVPNTIHKPVKIPELTVRQSGKKGYGVFFEGVQKLPSGKAIILPIAACL